MSTLALSSASAPYHCSLLLFKCPTAHTQWRFLPWQGAGTAATDASRGMMRPARSRVDIQPPWRVVDDVTQQQYFLLRVGLSLTKPKEPDGRGVRSRRHSGPRLRAWRDAAESLGGRRSARGTSCAGGTAGLCVPLILLRGPLRTAQASPQRRSLPVRNENSKMCDQP